MRKNWIDIAKGIVILLVCVGHTRLGEEGPLASWITSFHMSFFFLMAGYCFDEDRYRDVGAYVWRKCKVLVYPYVMLSLLAALLFTAFYWQPHANFFGEMLLPYPGHGVLGFWFVRSLLGIELAYGVVAILQRRRGASSPAGRRAVRLAVALGACVVGYVTERQTVGWYSLYAGLVASLFYALGECLRSLPIEKTFSARRALVAAGGVAAVHAGLLGLLGFPVCGKYGAMNPVAFVGTGLAGFVTMSMVAGRLDRSLLGRLLAYVGRNSLLLLVLQPTIGLCRRTWCAALPMMTGALSFAVDFALIVLFMWLVPRYLGFFLRIPCLRKETPSC